LYEFQTIIAGLVGFFGVVVALLWNSNADRRRQRDKEKTAANRLRVSLISELEQVVLFMRGGKDISNGADGDATLLVPTAKLDRVFLENIGRLGDLTCKEIKAVINAYAMLDTYWSKLSFMGSISEQHPNHVRLEARWIEAVPVISGHVISASRDAIKILSKHKQ
jgi:hypothetical protein